MNRSLSSSLALIVAVVLCFQLANAQQDNSITSTQSAEARLREKAFQLLESLADQITSLQSAENRARMGSNIAESLWTHDDKRARALFKLVEDDIKLGFQQSDNDPDEQTFRVFLKLREDNVERLAKHDPELALAFLRETLPLVKETARRPSGEVPPHIIQNEHALVLRLAKRIGARSPDVAVQLARQALEHQLSDDLFLLLIKLSNKNREQAQILYKEIVAKLRDADFAKYWPVMRLAHQLVGHFRPPAADESTYGELISIFLTKAFAHGCDKPRREDHERTSLCVQIGVLVPLLEKFSPQARRLRHWAPQDREYEPDTLTPGYSELNELYENGTIEEILALASKYPQLAGPIQMRALAKAEAEGDLERAQKIASAYSGDPEFRRQVEARVEYYSISDAKLEERLAAAQKELNTLPPPRQAELLLSLAHFTAPRHKKFAVKLLNQISGLVDTLNPGEKQTLLQIGVAMIYCLANNDRGFAIMESLLPKLNELIAAAAKLDGYDTRYVRDGEWNMTGAGAVGNILTILARHAQYFGWCDFDRAVSLAGQFERAEIRMMAQLKLAQGILAGPPKQIPHARRPF